MSVVKRKGASRIADVPPDILKSLNSGQIEAATLVENLATDFNQLLSSILPDIAATTTIDADQGVTKRMAAVAAAIVSHNGEQLLPYLSTHQSDLARGWGAYVLAALPGIAFVDRVTRMRSFADDSHFGVREWAWLALRPHIVKQPLDAVMALESWVEDPSDNIRRFAVEATRPRGVWSAHIPIFKKNPETAKSLLDPLTSDPSRYVQDSVANWLNDAWKTNPLWVDQYCDRLNVDAIKDETRYIVKRALRNKV